jgi:hypothetical protein
MRLRRLKLVSLARHWLRIYDFEQLRAIAEFTPSYLGVQPSSRSAEWGSATLARHEAREGMQP